MQKPAASYLLENIARTTLGTILMLATAQVSAFPQTLNVWEERFGSGSDSGSES